MPFRAQQDDVFDLYSTLKHVQVDRYTSILLSSLRLYYKKEKRAMLVFVLGYVLIVFLLRNLDVDLALMLTFNHRIPKCAKQGYVFD